MQSGHGKSIGRTLKPISELVPGDVLDGRYRLVDRIGRGGFGDVWRAVELLPDGEGLRDVALKLLAPGVADSDWAEEAKLLASFSHPALVTIYAAGILGGALGEGEDASGAGGTPFVAMELLIGRTLADQLAEEGALDWRSALRIMREVAQALDVIHPRGVIHLDLKPANIFVTEGGHVKVLDFGISKSATSKPKKDRSVRAPMASDATLPTAAFLAGSSDPFAPTQRAAAPPPPGSSMEKIVVGTPGFVAPEVLELGEPTMLADVYALGVTLAVVATGGLPQAISGEPPENANLEAFKAFWFELREATLRGSMRDLSKGGLPRGVIGLIERLCAVDPARRRVEEGGLFRVIDEVWQRPHDVPVAPYPGVLPYGPLHEGYLFGREQDLLRMQRHLGFEGALCIAGPAGAGKTSFVAALLCPELEKRRFDGRQRVRTVTVSLAEGPNRALTRAFDELAIAAPEEGERRYRGWGAALSTQGGARAHGRVLVLDDFEALLGFGEADRDEVVAFVEHALTLGRVSGYRLVVLLEQEAVEEVLALSPALAGLAPLVRYLAPPPEAAAREIALEPARAAAWVIEDGSAIAKMVEGELARGGVPLPGVALMLAACVVESEPVPSTKPVHMDRAAPTSSVRHAIKKLSAHALRGAGGASGVLHAHAEAAIERLGAERDRAMALLVGLTTSEGGALRVPLPRLSEKLDGEPVDALVARLRTLRLVRVRGGDAELAHTELASWPRLTSVRLSMMEVIALGERIHEAATAWERANMQASYLDRGDLLSDIARHGLKLQSLSGLEVEFLEASRRARRRRRFVELGAVVTLLALMVAGFVYKQRVDERRREAESAEALARAEARRVGLVARARQSNDPYARVAYFVAALQAGAVEPALHIELLGAAHNLPPGRFLSLDPVESPRMPWNDRWVVGRSPEGTLVVFDLRSPNAEAEVIDHVDVAEDPEQASVVLLRPKRFDVPVGSAPVVEVVPVLFDTSVLALNAEGELSLIRLRESGEVSLAAVAPMRCRGELAVAARAPVVVCVSRGEATAWDFVSGKTWSVDGSRGGQTSAALGAFVLSPDGKRLVTWIDRSVTVFQTFSDAPPMQSEEAEPVVLAAHSPRDSALVAVTAKGFRVFDPTTPSVTLFEGEAPESTVSVAWDQGGLDLGFCRMSGFDRWVHLEKGERPAALPPPQARCDGASVDAPPFASSRFYLGSFAMKDFGEHFSSGAFQLPGKRWLSTTLVVSGETDEGLERVLRFARRDDKLAKLPEGAMDSWPRVVRSGQAVAIQLARDEQKTLAHEDPTVAVVDADTGQKLLESKGFLLGACEGDRVLAYRVREDHYDLVDVRALADLGSVPREPGLVIGLSPGCTKLYTQRLDGTIVAHDLKSRGAGRPIATAHGYAFEAKPSAAFTGAGAGLLLALSSGEILRVDEGDDSVRLLTRARPRAGALADGIEPGGVLFSDARGVFAMGRDGQTEKLAGPRLGAAWEDALSVDHGRAVLLASAQELAVIDLESRAITGSVALRGMNRLEPWGKLGTVLAYAPDVEGLAHGVVVPFGPDLPSAIGSLSSNLRVDDKDALALKR